MSRTFRFRIYQELLTWSYLLFQIRIIHFVDGVVRINICCLDGTVMLGVFMLSSSVKSWKLLLTKFTLRSKDRFWAAVFFSNMIFEVIMGFSGEIRTLGTKQCKSRTTLLVTSKIRLCSLGTTKFTRSFFVPTERMHFSISSPTE